ncbi:calcitonin receptor-stimulating peptide 1-like [Physeter macrocephalus]|uniref:Calcitonin receptor-stimulating peptide 1 n=1 Tax=Physeter macrocephalus TaxID=9755 RepID=A0A2Y9SFC0_PHYMC|nr:calcitonin receptor-stimulating peptide 1-like [Physeter catodon]|eukprot:XP_023974489.1 calcitonin receptor-stimulating peptide 1-like [Physeter catodon]
MGFWKFSRLVLSILVLYQAGMFHSAPLRLAFDSPFDPATLNEEELRLLLAAMVNDYEQMRARQLEKEQKTKRSSITAQKRACNTATCMTHRLAGLLSRSGSMVKSNLLPTKMGFKIFGGRRRNFWIRAAK